MKNGVRGAGSRYHEVPARDIREQRLELPLLSDAILGSLAYLYDAQVHDEKSYSGKYQDFLISPSGNNRSFSRYYSGFRSFLGKQIIKERHLRGAWPAYIHFLPDLEKMHARPFLVATDYNHYTTVSTACPLMLFDDQDLPEKRRVVESMLSSANAAILGFARGDAYNFWRLRLDKRRGYCYSGPSNIPLWFIRLRWYLLQSRLLGIKFYESDILINWLSECYDKRRNPSGSAAIFNIPNDADNTSMAVAFQLLYNEWLIQSPKSVDLGPLEQLALFRDKDRQKSDRYSMHTGQETGAFLTWFKDELTPIFSMPERGIIPLAVNNVDIVVNANVLFALALAGKHSTPGYREAVSLLAKSVENQSWHSASLYYPHKYVFPYVVSRTWRDAAANEPLLARSLLQLMPQLLAGCAELLKEDTGLAVDSRGKKHDSHVLSIALILNTLLNSGRSMAEQSGLLKPYDETVGHAVQFLIRHRQVVLPRQDRTTVLFPGNLPNFWASGILYSSSMKQLAHWRSHAQTTSLVMEALAKYLLAYEYHDEKFVPRRIALIWKDSNLALSV